MRDILILSNSEKKAIKRDIAILDRYATRINNNTWTTKITDNGIEVLLSHLKNNATKQTSISEHLLVLEKNIISVKKILETI